MGNQQSKLVLITTFLALLCCQSCSSDDESINTPANALSLIEPVETTIDYCCPTFKWSTNTTDSSRLQISQDENFEQLLIDTLLNTETFTYEEKMTPNATYYWRVFVSNLSESSFFSIEDIFSQFEGAFQVTAVRNCYGQAPDCDSFFLSTVELIKDNDKIILIEGSSDLNETHCFYDYWGEPNQLGYFCPLFSTNGSYFVFDVDTDSIEIYNIFGGLGGGTRWTFKGKLE